MSQDRAWPVRAFAVLDAMLDVVVGQFLFRFSNRRLHRLELARSRQGLSALKNVMKDLR